MPDELLRLIDILNPANEPGRITLIARFGSEKVEQGLAETGARGASAKAEALVWSCDPMHGNTFETASGYKTRPVRPHSRPKCARS